MTTNHPAHGPVSLDRLHQISEILSKAAAQSDGGNLGYAMADAVKVIDGAIAAFGAEPAEFLPDNLDMALTILGVALPISKEEFNLDAERWMQRLINRVIRLESELIPPAPLVPTFDEWLELRGNKPLGWVKDAMRESYDACRAAMLQAGNSPLIGIDLAAGPDRTVEARYCAPPGYVMVPIEPTEDMVIAGFESRPDKDFSEPEVWDEYQEMSGCQQAAHRAKLCWYAMISAAPQQEMKR
ncbi:hypothetical protein [Citrobacter freundii]|uniref:hypothetical protein n=1 Tax=Citrobacter freundii TaxID=546 RepID=UPI0028C341D0|nr:hypothetical protein [Citrobacter freundii]